MHRAFSKNITATSSQIIITEKEEVHHIKNVLRLKACEEITLLNGNYLEALCRIENLSSREITLTVKEVKTYSPENPQFILACAIPKKSKFEMIIEKATELGVNRIIPLLTERTEVILKGDKAEKKRERFEAVALNAAKQSKRVSIPIIETPINLKTALETIGENTRRIIPSLQPETQPLADVLKKESTEGSLCFFIGPEGDFTEEEYALANASGCIAVTLGKTTLKVETAAICALSCANILLRK